jgi:uncharacterized membrane protein YGL010W
MRKIDGLLQAYDISHQHPANRTIRWFCVPAMFFSVVGLLYSIPPGPMEEMEFLLSHFANWATPVVLLVLVYYLTLSPPLALGMFLFAALCLAMASLLSLLLPFSLWIFCLFLFLTAGMVQLRGHRIEGKKSSLLTDLQSLLIGPAWLMHFIYRRLGIAY